MPHGQGRASCGWIVTLALLSTLPQYALAQTSLRFYGDIDQDVNRIKIRVDPHTPVDDYNHGLGQNVSGYVRQCARVSP